LVEALTLLEADAIAPESQDEAKATYAPKISQEMGRIRWEEPATRIARLVRGLDPRPGAWTELEGRRIKLFGPRPGGSPTSDEAPGTILDTDPAFTVMTGDGALQLLDVQPESKSRMAARDWIRGRGAHPGSLLA
jgi:methionyl-tRNA formyltransferase